MTLINCEFTNNYAKYAGGAIASIGHLSCNGSKFTGNTADGDGGAIFCLSLKSSVDLEKLLKYKSLGVNRISLGLQSIHENELKRLGRIHNFNDFV